MWENSSRYDTFVGINFHYQDNFEHLADLNVLVSIIFKISRENNLTSESQIHDTRENILITQRIFDGVTTDFGKIIVWKKVTSIAKPREFGRIFLIYFLSYDRIL